MPDTRFYPEIKFVEWVSLERLVQKVVEYQSLYLRSMKRSLMWGWITD